MSAAAANALRYVDEAWYRVMTTSAGVGAGICATPADVVMTRYQASSTYRSAFGAAADILRKDGVLAFYRGFTPFVVRLGPVFLISLPLTEQIRRLAGLGYLS